VQPPTDLDLFDLVHEMMLDERGRVKAACGVRLAATSDGQRV
jgi:hypothetical protein